DKREKGSTECYTLDCAAAESKVTKFLSIQHRPVFIYSFLFKTRRYNYTTPKSFLEQIKLYQSLLLSKDRELKAKMERLENGLEKLKSTSAQAKLAAQEVELKQKNEDADKLIQVVGVETEKVSRKKAVADEEERKVALIAQEVEQKQKDCEEDLAKAEPALAAAQFNKESIHENCLKALQPYLQDPSFNPEFVATKSAAAAGLCSWVLNIERFHRVFCEVQPKRQALDRANAELAITAAPLAGSYKTACFRGSLLSVGGLASENVRWAEAVKDFKQQQNTLCGDVLLVTAFVSYLGYFTRKYRQELLDGIWRPYLHQLKVSPDCSEKPLLLGLMWPQILAAVAAWRNQGLPADRTSSQNAAILSSCQRWPLLVDPQLQGSKWIKNTHGDALRVIQAGQKG
uniref:Dynein heavy chain coiled coil stalk domain-containing protein n=1 Tax=Junco hyemalis TaxID=40217 RepID=A0A8C5JB81_JUNHY